VASDIVEPRALEAASEGEASRPALRRCTAVPLDRFAEEIWGRQPSLSRAADLPGFADLFSLTAADDVLSRQGLRTPFVRVAKDGTTLPPARYTSGGGVGAGIADQASSVRLAQLFSDGSSIVLQALHRTHAPVIDFAQALGFDLGHPVQVNAYLTPPQSQGFSDHYDVHDVFVLQISGQKRWRIHAPVHPAPLRNQPWTDHRAAVEAAARTEPLIDEVLSPGDALYLPRGYLHAATALGETSAHLTVGIHVWTRRHLLEQVLAAMDDVDELRTALPLGLDVTDPPALEPELARTVRSFVAHLGTVTAQQVADGMVGEAMNSAKGSPVAPLAQAGAAARVGPDDRLRWRPALPVAIRRESEHLVVRTPDGTVRVPADAGDSIERLRRGDVVTVAELADGTAGPAGGVALAQILLRSCLTVLV
jgi:bifunctional lysine-specific demethylase and histidyl-hydroxylase NO66